MVEKWAFKMSFETECRYGNYAAQWKV